MKQITITIKDKDYIIPNSYDTLSISQFQDIYQIQSYSISENEKNRLIIATILNCNIEIVNQLKLEQVNDILICLEFINSEIKSKESQPFTLNGEVYYPIQSISDLEFGAFIDLDVLLNQDMISNIHKIISIIYRRKKGKKLELYDSKHSESIADDIAQQVNIGYVYHLLLFFCPKGKLYTTVTQNYLTQMKQMLKMKM